MLIFKTGLPLFFFYLLTQSLLHHCFRTVTSCIFIEDYNMGPASLLEVPLLRSFSLQLFLLSVYLLCCVFYCQYCRVIIEFQLSKYKICIISLKCKDYLFSLLAIILL